MSIIEQDWFIRIGRPSRYLGNEVNAIIKEPRRVEVSIALAFPDIYEVGMSHHGLKILYHILNLQPWISAERVFCPWVDLEEELRRRSLPLATLESRRPLSDFDILGFSLQHELSYTNVLNMLDLSGIPFLAKNREERHPLVIAGGPACFNPEPVADFFDLMVIGDGEEVALKICQIVREAKRKRQRNKEEILFQLSDIKGVYVPSFFDIHYHSEGSVRDIEPLIADAPFVEKAILQDIDTYPYPSRQVVPFSELVHDRLAIEISRGCTRGCRFCQAGMIYRPVRERGPESIIRQAEAALKLTGYEDVSFLSLSAGDYGCIEPLLKLFMDRQAHEKIAVSLPSLRVNSLSPELAEQIKRVRKTGFTLAVEAGNDRLRSVINKGLAQDEVLKMARQVYESGWNLIKLYFMIGLPCEEEKDIQDIVQLAKQIAGLSSRKGKKPVLNVSVSTFVPKAQTPFQWRPQISLEESRRRIQSIQRGLRSSRIRVKWNQPEMSWLEGVFSRGDRRLSQVLVEAWQAGSKFDAWGEHFMLAKWKEAFTRTGVNPHFYLHRERSLDEILPWDHIRCGVTKGYFKKEWERALEGKSTPDCRERCLECGVCDHKTVDPVLHRECQLADRSKSLFAKKTEPVFWKYRLTFNKLGQARYLSHLELLRTFTRAFRRAGLHLCYSNGFHPTPKLSFVSALPVGTESLQETLDVEFASELGVSEVREQINGELPSGLEVILIERLSCNHKKTRLRESHFLVTVKGVALNPRDLQRFMISECFPLTKITSKGTEEINARALVKSMALVSSDAVSIAMIHHDGPELKPVEIVKGVFSLNPAYEDDLRVLKTRQLIT